MTYLVGTTVPTLPVTHTIYAGTNNTGKVISRRNIPAGDWSASSPLILQFDEDIGFGESPFFVELTSTTPFSLQTDSGANIITTLIGQKLFNVELLTNDFILNNDLGFVFNNDLDMVRTRGFERFPPS